MNITENLFAKKAEELPEAGYVNENGDYILPFEFNSDEDNVYDEIYGDEND